MPSNWCRACGHIPSWGNARQRGHPPLPPEALPDSNLGVMGPWRSIAELEITLEVLAGPAEAEAIVWRLELPPARASNFGWRYGSTTRRSPSSLR